MKNIATCGSRFSNGVHRYRRALFCTTLGNRKYDVTIIGGGPGGYACAIKSAQLGLKTLLVDQNVKLGGTCLNLGCIPSKCLLNSSAAYASIKNGSYESRLKSLGIRSRTDIGYIRHADIQLDLNTVHLYKNKTITQLGSGLDGLMRKYGVDCSKGRTATILDGHTVQLTPIAPTDIVSGENIGTNYIVIATGSKHASSQFTANGDTIVRSDEALGFDTVPDTIGIVGGGVIGLEMASIWARFGSRVTVFESNQTILGNVDEDLGLYLHSSLAKNEGLTFHLGVTILDIKSDSGNKASISVSRDIVGSSIDNEYETYSFTKIIIATGRVPNTDGLGLQNVGICVLHRGEIITDNCLRTSIPNIFAIGDATCGPMLAHKASEEGVYVAHAIEKLVSDPTCEIDDFKNEHTDSCIPLVIYTNPEVAWVGLSKEDIDKFPDKRSFKFPLKANARARISGSGDGFVKIVTTGEDSIQRHRILGVGVVHDNAGELINTAVLALKNNLPVEALAKLAFPHPTLSESIKEAAMGCVDGAVHI